MHLLHAERDALGEGFHISVSLNVPETNCVGLCPPPQHLSPLPMASESPVGKGPPAFLGQLRLVPMCGLGSPRPQSRGLSVAQDSGCHSQSILWEILLLQRTLGTGDTVGQLCEQAWPPQATTRSQPRPGAPLSRGPGARGQCCPLKPQPVPLGSMASYRPGASHWVGAHQVPEPPILLPRSSWMPSACNKANDREGVPSLPSCI